MQQMCESRAGVKAAEVGLEKQLKIFHWSVTATLIVKRLSALILPSFIFFTQSNLDELINSHI